MPGGGWHYVCQGEKHDENDHGDDDPDDDDHTDDLIKNCDDKKLWGEPKKEEDQTEDEDGNENGRVSCVLPCFALKCTAFEICFPKIPKYAGL